MKIGKEVTSGRSQTLRGKGRCLLLRVYKKAHSSAGQNLVGKVGSIFQKWQMTFLKRNLLRCFIFLDRLRCEMALMRRISNEESAKLQNQRSGSRLCLFRRWWLSLGLTKQSLEKVAQNGTNRLQLRRHSQTFFDLFEIWEQRNKGACLQKSQTLYYMFALMQLCRSECHTLFHHPCLWHK